MVSMANMVRALDEELYDYGINLSEEYDYVENLIKVHGLDDTHIGKGTQLFLDAAEELGLNPIKMPGRQDSSPWAHDYAHPLHQHHLRPLAAGSRHAR